MGRCFYCVLILASVTAFSLENSARAYPTPVDFDGKLLRWDISLDDAPITYEVQADVEDDAILYAQSITEATGLWNDVPTSYFTFAPAPDGNPAQVTIHLQNSLKGAPYSAGYTVFDKTDAHGPTHCSIYVSVGDGESYNSVAKTILHELGHSVGLGHSLIAEAIMSYKLDKNSFALDVDDEAAITRLYPADGSKPKLPPGCAVSAGQQGLNAVFLALFLLLPLWFARQPIASMRSIARRARAMISVGTLTS